VQYRHQSATLQCAAGRFFAAASSRICIVGVAADLIVEPPCDQQALVGLGAADQHDAEQSGQFRQARCSRSPARAAGTPRRARRVELIGVSMKRSVAAIQPGSGTQPERRNSSHGIRVVDRARRVFGAVRPSTTAEADNAGPILSASSDRSLGARTPTGRRSLPPDAVAAVPALRLRAEPGWIAATDRFMETTDQLDGAARAAVFRARCRRLLHPRLSELPLCSASC